MVEYLQWLLEDPSQWPHTLKHLQHQLEQCLHLLTTSNTALHLHWDPASTPTVGVKGWLRLESNGHLKSDLLLSFPDRPWRLRLLVGSAPSSVPDKTTTTTTCHLASEWQLHQVQSAQLHLREALDHVSSLYSSNFLNTNLNDTQNDVMQNNMLLKEIQVIQSCLVAARHDLDQPPALPLRSPSCPFRTRLVFNQPFQPPLPEDVQVECYLLHGHPILHVYQLHVNSAASGVGAVMAEGWKHQMNKMNVRFSKFKQQQQAPSMPSDASPAVAMSAATELKYRPASLPFSALLSSTTTTTTTTTAADGNKDGSVESDMKESANTVEEGKGAHGENVLFLNGSVDGSTEKEEDMKKLAFDFRQRSCSVQAQWQLHAVEQQPLLGPFQQVMQRLHQLERICHEWGYYGKLAHGIDLS